MNIISKHHNRKNKGGSNSPSEPLSATTHKLAELMHLAINGDQTAFAKVDEYCRSAVLYYLRSLNGHSSQHDLDDMTQEVFTRAWRDKERYKGASSVRTWLFGYAGNVFCEQIRLKNRGDRGIGVKLSGNILGVTSETPKK